MFLHFKNDRHFFRILLPAIIVMILLRGIPLFAQLYPLKVTVVVTPPYSTRISDYINTPNKIIVTITNTSFGPSGKTYDYFLKGSMSCDAGQSIKTDPAYIPPKALHILPGQTYRLTQGDIQELYDANHLVYNGITQQQILQQGGFPEGYYTICVSAYDYSSHHKLTADEPSGCTSFLVTNLEAPIIQKPVCGDTLKSQLQAITFSWTPPAGCPPTTMYRLRIVELLSGTQIPPDAFYTTPPNQFFEVTTMAPVYIYTSALPPFTDGRRYAFAIQAFDKNGNAGFKNKGWSEVCYFIYKKFDYSNIVHTTPTISPTSKTWTASLSGRINYAFNMYSAQHPMKNENISLQVVYVVKNATVLDQNDKPTQMAEYVLNPLLQGMTGDALRFEDDFMYKGTTCTDDQGNFTFEVTLDPDEKFGLIQQGFSASYNYEYPPLPVVLPNYTTVPGSYWGIEVDGAPVIPGIEGWNYNNLISGGGGDWGAYNGGLSTLIVSDLGLNNTSQGPGFVYPINNNLLGSYHHNYGALSGNQGQTQPMGLSGAMKHLGGVKGDLYRYLRVIVNDPYFNNPDDDFILTPNGSVTASLPLVGLVNSYILKVEVVSDATADQAAGTDSHMAGVRVEIGRKPGFPKRIPPEEGDNLKREQTMFMDSTCILVASGETSMTPKGFIEFDNLVHNGYDLDSYKMITSTSKRKGVFNYFPDIRQLDPMGAPPKFNSQFIPPEPTIKIVLTPDYPRIAGRVMYKNFPIQGALCMTNISDQKVYTDKEGYFELSNLNVIDDNANLTITKYGYEDKTIDNLGKFQVGGQYWNDDIELIPWGYISGRVVDEQNHPLEAEVQIDSLPYYATETDGSGAQVFKFRAPSGPRKLHVVPVSANYMDETLFVALNKTPDDQPPQDIGTIKLTTAQHRIRIFAFHYSGDDPSGQPEGIPGTWVELNGESKKVDNNGYANFVFPSPATNFNLFVTPPDQDPCYVPVEAIISNTPTKSIITYNAELHHGKTITGYVKADPGMSPVKNARVFISESSSNPTLSERTDENGFFRMKGVPQSFSKVTVSAVKSDSSSSYIGDSKEVDLTVQSPTVNLTLHEIKDFDLSQIMGFFLEASSFMKKLDGSYVLSGHLWPLNNDDFTLANYGFRLDFSDLAVKKSNRVNAKGIPYLEPVDNSIKTDNFDMLLKYHSYQVKQISPKEESPHKVSPITVTKDATGNGVIQGQAYIEKTSFQYPSALLDYSEGKSFNLADLITGNQNITTIVGKNSSLPAKKFRLCSSSGSDMPLTLVGFSSLAAPSGSYINGDSIVLHLSMTANLNGNIKVILDADKVKMNTSVIQPIVINKSTEIKLGEKWKITADKFTWNSGQDGFKGTNALLMTGFSNIPVKQMKLTANSILLNDFNISNLFIGNVAPINIRSDAECMFYFDPKVGEMAKPHYVVKIISENVTQPVANLKNLPGMQSGSRLDIGSIQILDNDEQLYAGVENSAELLLYDVFHLKVNQVTSHSDFFTLTGIYNINLPRLPNYNRANINFFRNPNTGKPMLNMDPIPLEFTGPADVFFKANQVEHADTLFPGTFECLGKLTFSDQGVSKTLDARLVRTTNEGYVMVFPETQSIVLSKSNGPNAVRLDNVNGRMTAQATDWDFFWFKGLMANMKNTGSTKESNKFFVKGAITSDGNSVTVDNINTPLGNVKLTYDLQNNVLHGSLVLNKLPLLGFSASGGMEMEFGSNGWYLGGTADLVSPDPFLGELSAGLAFGCVTQVPQVLKDVVLLNAKNKDWPENLNSLKGFFFTGYKSFFPPVNTDAGFSIGGYFVGYKVNVDAGFDSRFSMNFDPGGTTLGFGLMAYGNASAYLGLYAGAICPFIEGGIHVGFGIKNGTINFSTGKIKIGGNAFVGMDLDGGVCLGPFCTPCLSKGFHKTLNCDVTIENQPKNVDFSVSLSD